MKLSRYCIIYPDLADPDSVILYSTKRASAALVERSALAAIEKGELEGDEKETLTALGLLVDSEREERLEMIRFLDELNELDTGLSVMAVMNLDCNLACPYCFEGSRRGRHYMSPETAGRIIGFMDKYMAKGRDRTGVAFYGGEPLLSVDLVQEMACRMKYMAEENGINFSFTLTTNGTLLNADIVGRLGPLGLKAATITIDGPEDIHNASRPYATGAGSFSRIIDNIKAVCGELEINIGGNYRKDNYREFPRLLDYLLRQGLTPDKIGSIGFVPVLMEREGIVSPEFSGGCLSINEPWLFDASLFLRKEIMARGFPVDGVSPAICAAERKWMFIINYDGDIYKCPGMIGRHEYKVGDVVNGIGDYSVSHCMDNWKNDKCLDCVYLPLCFGGCRYMNLLSAGKIAGLDCRKPYYDACLEGFVMQDLGR
jgi:uncharacterized protein